MQIIKGKQIKPLKVVVYGPEGIGKSTIASQFPDPLFIDTEDSTANMDVARFPKPSSWTMLLSQAEHVKNHRNICQTLIVDTADWAERLCAEHICAKSGVSGIEDFGWGKGYTYLEEEWGRFLNKLQEIIEVGINVVITAHAEIKKIEQPEEIGGYDHWQLKLEKKTAPLLKEWADLLLFANYKTLVVNVDSQGAQKGKNKAQGGKRVMYTTHTPWWDAKNRHGLDPELPFEYAAIAHCIPIRAVNLQQTQAAEVKSDQTLQTQPTTTPAAQPQDEPPVAKDEMSWPIPKALAELMVTNSVKYEEVQAVVTEKGYYPKGTPIENYDTGFIDGVLVAAWPQVFDMIKKKREDEIPY
ncbi:MAG: phage protein [Bacillota bacterium]|jgi:hypothetical protein|nr:phage protein [Bacillota bacterium]